MNILLGKKTPMNVFCAKKENGISLLEKKESHEYFLG